MIEASGVPHPEVDLILIDGQPVDFAFVLEQNERVDVYSVRSEPSLFPKDRLQTGRFERFVADGHLGKLAANLRLLGFAPRDPLETLSETVRYVRAHFVEPRRSA